MVFSLRQKAATASLHCCSMNRGGEGNTDTCHIKTSVLCEGQVCRTFGEQNPFWRAHGCIVVLCPFPKKHDGDGDDEDKFPPLVVPVFKWFLKKARSINVSRPFVCRPRQRLNLTDVCSVAKRATVAKTELKTFCVAVLLPKMSRFLSEAQISGFSKWRHLVVAQCVATVSKNPQKPKRRERLFNRYIVVRVLNQRSLVHVLFFLHLCFLVRNPRIAASLFCI